MELNYSISKLFRLNGNLRYIHDANKRKRPGNSLRYNLGIQLRLKINKKFLFSFKAQFQQKFTYEYGAFAPKETSSTRYKAKLRFKYNKYHKFYFSTEVFVRSDLTSVPFFDKQRFNIGDNIKIKTGEFNVDLNAKVYKLLDRNKRIWFALSYRQSLDGNKLQELSQLTPIAGFEIDRYLLSYTYTHQLGNITYANGGFHQFTLGINLFNKRPKDHGYIPRFNPFLFKNDN